MVLKAFVTGGTGFVGANLIRLLKYQGYAVKALVRPTTPIDNLRGLEVEIVEGTLNDDDLASKLQGCQVLFHVAAHYSLWQKDKEILYRSNVLGTRQLLTAARQVGIERTVYTSSVAAIGVGKNGQPVAETYQSPVQHLISDYKKSKYWAEQEARKAVDLGQDVVIVNPSTPIGAYDLKPTPTGDIILRFLRRQMPAYVNTGLNLIDVEDVAWGHLLALEKGKTGERYILGHQNLTLKEVLDRLAQITGLNAPKTQIPVWIPWVVAGIDEFMLSKVGKTPSIPFDGVRMSRQLMYYDGSKAVKELGLPQSSIEQALAKSVNWFQNHRFF